ncbi:MAG: aminotransferase class I/II-fold pyridoxal phosphate-dependent enzyme [Bacteroidaceae bacterium]|nr:aminotransferase class I/II-fold pyridoxal phosphate-dependent enzyme [Bacteroidaceae bacterium]
MIHLESDYNNGAHQTVLRHLTETNDERTQSYGDDRFSEQARNLIREACKTSDAQIWFLAGGTQTNATIIDCVLQPYEGVLCAETAHINVHEAGAVEFTGHKVIALPAREGKLNVKDLQAWLTAYFADDTAEHMVRPGMVYITFPTELGTLYSAEELKALHDVCRKYDLKLYVDGARLAYGLAASPDVTLPLLAQTTDVFYIGGTKCGALCGEAVVFPKGDAPTHMLSRIKRHGALLAKSRVVGVQFEALFTSTQPETPLYLEIGQQAVALAMRLRRLFVESMGYHPFIDSPTNQQFYIVPNDDLGRLRQLIGFEVWCPVDDHNTACRFVTSWATTDAEIEELEKKLGKTGL